MEERNKRSSSVIKRKSSEENNDNHKSNSGGFGSRERFKGNSDAKRPRKRIIKGKDEESQPITKKKLSIKKKSSDGYVPKKRIGLAEGKEEKRFEKKKPEGDDRRKFEGKEENGKKRLVKKSSEGSEYGRKKTEGRGGRSSDKPVFKKRFNKAGENDERGSGTRKYSSGSDKSFDRKPNRFEESGKESRGSIAKSPYSKKKQLEFKQANPDLNESIRLNKYIANAGICSRREADEYIKAGVVRINDVIITELGTKVMPGDTVKFNDSLLKSERKVYLLLNKPKDYITTTEDPHAKNTVMELIEGACRERIYPVGRLDRNTTGLLLFTNDGEIAKKLTHPKYGKKKIYHVYLDKNFNPSDMEKLLEGFETQEGFIQADEVSFVDESDRKQVGVELHTGQNHAIKHLFETLGYRVEKLDRVYFAGLTKKNLPRGEWRFLTDKEIGMLRMGAYS